METVGIRDLKTHLSRHLKRVRAGARLLVTERGRSIATISPVEAPTDSSWVYQLVAEGHGQWGGGSQPAPGTRSAPLASDRHRRRCSRTGVDPVPRHEQRDKTLRLRARLRLGTATGGGRGRRGHVGGHVSGGARRAGATPARGGASGLQLRSATRQLDQQWPSFVRLNATEALCRTAGELAERSHLRAFDSVHLASFDEVARRAGPRDTLFCSFDERLNQAARKLARSLARQS